LVGGLGWICPPGRRVGQGARPELEHTMLFLRDNGLLGLHWCQLRDILILFSTLAGGVSLKMLTWHECDKPLLQSVMEPGTVDAERPGPGYFGSRPIR
jgi:hypothetical protein